MYCSVVPAFDGRADRQPEELLDGTGKDVVVVGGVVVGVAAEADADAGGTNGATATPTAQALNSASTESVGSLWRAERARLS